MELSLMEAAAQKSIIISSTLITDKNISFSTLEVIKQIKREWVSLNSRYSIQVIHNGFISIKFENQKDKNWVMDSAPWLVFQNQYVLLLKEWCSPNDFPPKIEFTTCPFWIQVHNIPTITITKHLGFKIGEVIGYEVLEVDLCERKRRRNNFMRIRVAVNVTKRLATGFWLCISRTINEVYWVSLKYENLPKKICYRCGILGHDKDCCSNDEFLEVPNDEKCIVNYIANSSGYEGTVPSRLFVDGKTLEEDESERGYGPWLYEEKGQDVEDEDSEDSDDGDGDGGDEECENE